jgi:hypothetical protein
LSVASSYEHIGPDEGATESADSPQPSPIEPQPIQEGFDSATPQFRTLYSQAQVLVDKDTMIMPFNTPAGHVHILRQLSPDVVYIQESLTGANAEVVKNISGWVRQIFVVVDDVSNPDAWWQSDEANLGKRLEVVDAQDAGEHWRRRISSRD